MVLFPKVGVILHRSASLASILNFEAQHCFYGALVCPSMLFPGLASDTGVGRVQTEQADSQQAPDVALLADNASRKLKNSLVLQRSNLMVEYTEYLGLDNIGGYGQRSKRPDATMEFGHYEEDCHHRTTDLAEEFLSSSMLFR